MERKPWSVHFDMVAGKDLFKHGYFRRKSDENEAQPSRQCWKTQVPTCKDKKLGYCILRRVMSLSGLIRLVEAILQSYLLAF
jgi:hypothetical protein